MRKAVEHLSFSLGGWLHVADTFASSKDAHRQPQYVSECLGGMWKTPVLPLKRFPPPSQRLYDISLSFICQAVASKKVNCKHVAWTGCTESSCCVCCGAVCSALKPKKTLQETPNQEPLHSNKYDRNSASHYLSSKTHSLSVSSNEREQCKQSVHCAAEQETVPLNWG